MTASRFSRRVFLNDMGRGVLAIAVVGVAGCTVGGQATSLPGGPATRPPSRLPSAIPQAPAWQRVDLYGGFVSAFVLARAGEAAVVDTGYAFFQDAADGEQAIDSILAALEAAGLGWANVAHVILTHWHPDHAGGAAAILDAAPDAQGYAGAADIGRIEEDAGLPGYSPPPLPRPLIPVVDSDAVFGLRIVATPGHTPGHIAVLDGASGVLVAGDALTTTHGRVTAPPGGTTEDMAEALRSIAKLGALDFETLLVGHGEPIESGGAALVGDFLAVCPRERIEDAGSVCNS